MWPLSRRSLRREITAPPFGLRAVTRTPWPGCVWEYWLEPRRLPPSQGTPVLLRTKNVCEAAAWGCRRTARASPRAGSAPCSVTTCHLPKALFFVQKSCAADTTLFHSSTSKPCRPSNVGSSYIASMASTSRLAALAKQIGTQTSKLDQFFAESKLAPPSFEEDAPLSYPFPPDVAEAQEALSAALDELWWLNQGPIQTIVSKSVCRE